MKGKARIIALGAIAFVAIGVAIVVRTMAGPQPDKGEAMILEALQKGASSVGPRTDNYIVSATNDITRSSFQKITYPVTPTEVRDNIYAAKKSVPIPGSLLESLAQTHLGPAIVIQYTSPEKNKVNIQLFSKNQSTEAVVELTRQSSEPELFIARLLGKRVSSGPHLVPTKPSTPSMP